MNGAKILFLFLTLFTFSLGKLEISGKDLFYNLIDQWTFAYSDVSELEILYKKTANVTIQPGTMNIVSEYDLANDTSFACPVAAFPISVIYNLNNVIYTMDLLVTEHLLIRMITEPSMKWNDPELVQYNPLLAANTVSVRMVFNSDPNPVNDKILLWLFPNNGSYYNSSFYGLAASKHVFASGFQTVVTAVSNTPNLLAFVPYPYARNLNSDKIRLAQLVRFTEGEPENYTITNETLYTTIGTNSSYAIKLQRARNRLYATIDYSNETWPLCFFSYLNYIDNGYDCENNTLIARFFYWSFGNQFLYGKTMQTGFWKMDEQSFDVMKQMLQTMTCNNKEMLVYTDTSSKTRGNTIFIASLILVPIFIVMIIASWYIRPRKTFSINIYHLLCVFGLSLMLASSVIWWYTPRKTSFCVSRTWTLVIAYINVIAPIFGSVFTIYTMIRKSNKSLSPKLINSSTIAGAYIILNAIAIVLLVIWQFVEDPRSFQEVTDSISW
jgi:ABC-type phosphate transport system substrate-binding protein